MRRNLLTLLLLACTATPLPRATSMWPFGEP